jgi:hypothetical protein
MSAVAVAANIESAAAALNAWFASVFELQRWASPCQKTLSPASHDGDHLTGEFAADDGEHSESGWSERVAEGGTLPT